MSVVASITIDLDPLTLRLPTYNWSMLSHVDFPRLSARCCALTWCDLHVQGLEKGFDYKKVLKAFKKGEPSCGLPLL